MVPMKSLFFILLSLCLLTSCEKQWPATNTDLTSMPENSWFTVPLADGTHGANGSEFSLLVKKGSSKNLIIFFGGGGVTWDDHSATTPINIWKFLRHGMEGMGFYFNSVNPISLSLKGILDTKRANSFGDWNVAYIPYATGDFHIGNGPRTYVSDKGKKVVVHHNGQVNVAGALKFTYAAFEQPEKVLVMGASAGAFGSSFWLQKIAKQFPDSKIYHLADGGFLKNKNWESVAQDNWHSNAEAVFGITPDTDLIGGAIAENAKKLEHVTILQSHSAHDGTLTHFQKAIDPKVDWNLEAMKSVKTLSENPNYFYYVTEAKDHTISSFDLFYSIVEDGKSYEEWVIDSVLEDKPYSVGEKYLE